MCNTNSIYFIGEPNIILLKAILQTKIRTFLLNQIYYYSMPSGAPIIRAMSWGMILKKLPNDISKHLPNGDPLQNQKEIRLELNRLKILSPAGRKQMNKFVSGEIDYETYNQNLDLIYDCIYDDSFKKYQRKIEVLEKSMKPNPWRILPGVSSFDMDSKECQKSVQNLNNIHLYNKNKIKYTSNKNKVLI